MKFKDVSIKIAPLAVLFFIFLSLTLSGCSSFVNSPVNVTVKHIPARHESRKTVLSRLRKNYSRFGGMSGTITVKAEGKFFSIEQYGFFKYYKGKSIRFTVPDIYGGTVFDAFLSGSGSGRKVIFFYHGLKEYKTIYMNKEYSGRELMYKRLFDALFILLNIDSAGKVSNAGVFYNTYAGYFFEFNGKPFDYYIFVNRDFLIDRLVKVKNARKIETATFSGYRNIGGTWVPLKISVDDYLYNVKIEVNISKDCKVFSEKGQN